MNNPITVETTVNATIAKVWDYWNSPSHIVNWAFASEDWEAPNAENDLRTGGKFKTTMAAKVPSTGSGQSRESFDFAGTYTNVDEYKHIEYDLDDGRHVKVEFEEVADGVKITETFDPENLHTEDLQRAGWQAILDNFKKYTEVN